MTAISQIAGPAIGTLFRGIVSLGRIATAIRVARERRDLSQLDARMLADIGLTEAAAAREAARPFWDVPANR